MERFPSDFLWGAATAAYQIEGAAREDGRGESIWDRFSHTPGKVYHGDHGDIACDHYHRYQEDIQLLKQLGLKHYRLSISWPRLFPEGNGRLNAKGVAFYERLLDDLICSGITPMVTVYHWDLPQALEDRGGWTHRDTAQRFADYAAFLFQRFGAMVPKWVTLNEPWCSAALGYGFGVQAPGKTDWRLALQAGHHLLLGHGLAVQAFRDLAPLGQIGITLNLSPVYPATQQSEDQEAARRQDGFLNRWFLDPLFGKGYPQDLLSEFAPWTNDLSFLEERDLAVVSTPVDFLGINYYTRSIVRAGKPDQLMRAVAVPGPGPVTAMGWEIYPEGLYDLLSRLQADYRALPLYITENGAAFADTPDADGRIEDTDRMGYLRVHLQNALRFIEQGGPLRGYYIWSFLDNFEWAMGYSKRFGIVYVDYLSQQRRPKASAFWYSRVANSGDVTEP